MSDSEESLRLALMYQSDDDEEVAEEKPKQDRPYGIMNMPAMSSAIRKMQETIDAQDRVIKRLNQRIRNLERQSGNLTREINQIGSEMESKVDRSFR
ncbi:MAG: hypothetical protein EOP84_11065 [Verrucomicrobiaceae bacterium]|nr:MAG: hypothetical protein EOP84_11065 [Verrucomicrobiaceae bacterium]